jgi:hypothetical protein
MGSSNQTLYAVWSADQTAPTTTAGTAKPTPTAYAGPLFVAKSYNSSPGEALRLHGEKLDEVTSLVIGNAATTITLRTSEYIEVLVPQDVALGELDVKITSRFGQLVHQNLVFLRSPRVSPEAISSQQTPRMDDPRWGKTFLVPRKMISELASDFNELQGWMNELTDSFQEGTIVCTRVISPGRALRDLNMSKRVAGCPVTLNGLDGPTYRTQVKESLHSWFHDRLLITFAAE